MENAWSRYPILQAVLRLMIPIRLDFNDFEKIFQKYLPIKFHWVIRGRSTRPTLNKKNHNMSVQWNVLFRLADFLGLHE